MQATTDENKVSLLNNGVAIKPIRQYTILNEQIFISYRNHIKLHISGSFYAAV
jgi:hypothetical protein